MTEAGTIEALKARIRRDAVALRDALPPAERADAAAAIAARPLPMAVAPGAVVSGFSPLKSEINPIPLMRAFAQAGARLALPVVGGEGRALPMGGGAFGGPPDPGGGGVRGRAPAPPRGG